MEPKYIVAITALSLFCVLFLIFFILLAHKRKAEANLQAWLYKRYSDKNLIKLDYDSPELDEEASRLIEKGVKRSEAQKADQNSKDEIQLKIEDAFAKIEMEGIEEITGNYNPQ